MEVPPGRGTPRSRRSAKRSFSEHEQSNQIAEGVALADAYQSSLQTDDTTAIVAGSNVIGLAAPESVEFLLCDHPGCGKRLKGKSGLRYVSFLSDSHDGIDADCILENTVSTSTDKRAQSPTHARSARAVLSGGKTSLGT